MEEVKKDEERDGRVSEQEENGEIKKSHMGLRKILKDTEVADVGLMVLGTVGSVADGATIAVIMLLISTMMNTYAFNSKFTLHDIDKVRSTGTFQSSISVVFFWWGSLFCDPDHLSGGTHWHPCAAPKRPIGGNHSLNKKNFDKKIKLKL